MATQVLGLTGLGGEGWSGAALIDPALIEGGGTAYLRFVRSIGNNFQVRLSATATADPENVGPEFTEAFETAGSAFTFAAGGSTLVLKGPGNADNSFADASEPYFWSPDNGDAMSSWFASTVGNFTLTLTDGLPDVAVHAVRGAAAAGGAETRARIDVVPALALSDFDGRGLEFDVLALIRAGSGSGGTIYASAPRGAVGALLDGELGLGADEAAITRIRRRNGTMLAINDNDPLSLAAYFSPGGAGADLTLYIKTHDGAASFPRKRSRARGRQHDSVRPARGRPVIAHRRHCRWRALYLRAGAPGPHCCRDARRGRGRRAAGARARAARDPCDPHGAGHRRRRRPPRSRLRAGPAGTLAAWRRRRGQGASPCLARHRLRPRAPGPRRRRPAAGRHPPPARAPARYPLPARVARGRARRPPSHRA